MNRLATFCLSAIQMLYYFQVTSGAITDCGTKFINCECGNGKEFHTPMKICGREDPSAICAKFANCYECSSNEPERCLVCPQARGGFWCDEVLGCQTPELENGITEPFISSPYGASTGQEILYKCWDGFRLSGGNEIRVCNADGTWSGTEPLCVRENQQRIPVLKPIPQPKPQPTPKPQPEITPRPPIHSPPKQSTCGRSKLLTRRSPIKPLIINGTSSRVGQWPWTVAIKLYTFGDWDFHCGGALISEHLIVTAAHCVYEPGTTTLFPNSRFKIYVGKHKNDDLNDDNQVQVKKPEQIIVHPNFELSNLNFDIALIKVSPGFQLTDRVQPVCLPNEAQIDFRSGKKGTVIGWGTTETGRIADELKYAQLPVVDGTTCKNEYHKKGLNIMTDNIICAGYEQGGRDACNGDSGGPFVFESSQRTWILEGIVSWGGRRDIECAAPREYTSFTKVKNCIDWINRYL